MQGVLYITYRCVCKAVLKQLETLGTDKTVDFLKVKHTIFWLIQMESHASTKVFKKFQNIPEK